MEYHIVDETEFDEIFERTAVIADLKSEQDEEAYVRLDQEMIDRIAAICSSISAPDQDLTFQQLEDWWPNHTRYLYVAISCFSGHLLRLLHQLIRERPDWRIQVVVVTDEMPYEQVGMALLTATRCILTGSDSVAGQAGT